MENKGVGTGGKKLPTKQDFAPSFRLSLSSLSVLRALLFLEREEGEPGKGGGRRVGERKAV
jgi:hypothetical protein